MGDYIFVKDRSIIPGVNPLLRPTYSDDPHIVINDRPTTLVTPNVYVSTQKMMKKNTTA